MSPLQPQTILTTPSACLIRQHIYGYTFSLEQLADTLQDGFRLTDLRHEIGSDRLL